MRNHVMDHPLSLVQPVSHNIASRCTALSRAPAQHYLDSFHGRQTTRGNSIGKRFLAPRRGRLVAHGVAFADSGQPQTRGNCDVHPSRVEGPAQDSRRRARLLTWAVATSSASRSIRLQSWPWSLLPKAVTANALQLARRAADASPDAPRSSVSLGEFHRTHPSGRSGQAQLPPPQLRYTSLRLPRNPHLSRCHLRSCSNQRCSSRSNSPW